MQESSTINASVSVAIPCLNEADTIDRTLEGVARQTTSPESVFVADGGSTDGTIKQVKKWQDQLPLTILSNEKTRQAPGLNICLDRCRSTFFARLDAHTYWEPDYLETLLQELLGNKNLAAAGGVVTCPPLVSGFQRDVWCVMEHPLGTGAPSYRTAEEIDEIESVQSPVYRTEHLKQVGGFPENLPWAEDDGLHYEFRRQGWKLVINPSIRLHYQPRNSYTRFMKQFFNYGSGRGRLGNQQIFPTDRHETIDNALKLWTFGLCWNPVGWSLFVFYLMADVFITFERVRQKKCSPRFFLLLPVAHISYWLGWTTTRFSSGSSTIKKNNR